MDSNQSGPRKGPDAMVGAPQSPLRLADAGDAKPAWVTLLTTEHYNLQTQRAATIGEANGRASIFPASAPHACGVGYPVTVGAGPRAEAPAQRARWKRTLRKIKVKPVPAPTRIAAISGPRSP